ncbi:MAG TPA: 3-phosphoshikimate 1-carboxyvinyltransferase [Phycisphaerales bacterium]|nr:3-phosphoshikimate 1-carboxyvinyltransferase [Phycisphaerales bacterium]
MANPPASPLVLPLEDLPDPLPIPALPAAPPPRATVRPPGSKSLSNRALLLAALADGESSLGGALLDADDAQRMIESLRLLGSAVEPGSAGRVRVRGVRGRWRVPPAGVRLDLQNAGTATRFLAAAAALADGPITIDGNERMRRRPIGELAAALPSLGMRVEHLGHDGYPPLRLTPLAPAPPHNVALEFSTTKSSQFISALLMLGPWLTGGITIRLHGEVTSRPYIAMTLRLLDRLGAHVRASEDLHVLRVGPPEVEPATLGLPAFEYEVEPDASGATYFWAAGAMIPGADVGVAGLTAESLQGDACFPLLLERMGAVVEREESGVIRVRAPAVLRPIEADLADMPDAAMTLAAACAFAPGRSILRGLRTLRVKETDRIAALQNELGKIGVRVETDVEGDPDALSIAPPAGGVDCSPGCRRVEFETYDDHRMAMSMALIGLRRPNCFVRDPACVRKTYPDFWRDLATLSYRPG